MLKRPLCPITKEEIFDGKEWCDSFCMGEGCKDKDTCKLYPKLSNKKAKILHINNIYTLLYILKL